MTDTGISTSPPFGTAHRDAIEAAIEGLPDAGFDVVFLGRVEPSNGGFALTVTGDSESAFDSVLTLTCTDGTFNDCRAGAWVFDPGSSAFQVGYLEISGGGSGRVYEVTASSLSGFWNTDDLSAGASGNSPGLSHLDFYGVQVSGSAPAIPEPATIGLTLTGLGLIGLARRRRRSGLPPAL